MIRCPHLSRNAASKVSIMLDVHRMMRFGWDLTLSKPVSKAFVARIVSWISPLLFAELRDDARDSISSISTMVKCVGEDVQWARMAVKIWRMCLADSEKNLERRVAAFIWMRLVERYARFRRMESFWANAWHNVVFPVPGGPEIKKRRLVRGRRLASLKARKNLTKGISWIDLRSGVMLTHVCHEA